MINPTGFIRFYDNTELYKPDGKRVHPAELPEGINNARTYYPAVVKDISDSVGITLFGPNQVYTANCEFYENPNLIKRVLGKQLTDLYERKGPIESGVIYGGIAYNPNDSEKSDKSCNLVDTLEDICEDWGIPVAILTGLYNTTEAINAYVNSNTVNFYGELSTKIRDCVLNSKAELDKTLGNFFEYVKLMNEKIRIVIPKEMSKNFLHMANSIKR